MTNTTSLNYRIYLFQYGILSILFTLEYFTEIERYEECEKILDAIHKQNDNLGLNLPTKREDLKVKDVISIYKNHGLTGQNHFDNSKYYSELIINEICNLNR